MASTSTDVSIVKFLKPPESYNALMFGCVASFNLSAPPMNGCRFQAPPAVGQLLPSARTADLSEDRETLDSDNDDDDDNLPFAKQILATSKRAKRVINLTGDDDDDGEDSDNSFTEVSWLRITRTARHLIGLQSAICDRFLQLPDEETRMNERLRRFYAICCGIPPLFLHS